MRIGERLGSDLGDPLRFVSVDLSCSDEELRGEAGCAEEATGSLGWARRKEARRLAPGGGAGGGREGGVGEGLGEASEALANGDTFEDEEKADAER